MALHEIEQQRGIVQYERIRKNHTREKQNKQITMNSGLCTTCSTHLEHFENNNEKSIN